MCEGGHHSLPGSSCYIDLSGGMNDQTAGHYSDQWGSEKGFLEFIQSNPQAKLVMPAAKLGWDRLFDRIRSDAANEDIYVYDAACGFGGIANELVDDTTSGHMHYIGADIHGSLGDIIPRIPDLEKCGMLLRWDISRPIPVRERFDYVICRASLHHTPDPRASFRSLCTVLKPGGTVAISVYNKKGVCRESSDNALREVISRMPNDEAYRVCRQFTLLGQALQQIREEVCLTEDLPLLGIKKGKYKVQELFYYNFLKCFNNDNFGEEFSTLVNYDWYHPQYAYRYTIDEVKPWFSENKIIIEQTVSIEAQHYLMGKKK